MIRAEKLILGTVQFGLDYGINNKNGQVGKNEAISIMETAYQAGIISFDTARAYGNAENVIGQFIQQNQPKGLKLITKFHLQDDATWEEALDESLDNLKTDKVDTLLFHSFDAYLKLKDQLEDLLKNQKGKKFNRIGVSVYTNEELTALIEEDNIKVIQVPFNLLDNHNKRGELLQQLKDQGKSIMTRSVFLQGLFFKDIDAFPIGLAALKTDVQKIHALAEDNELAVGALALHYALSKSYIDGVLFGVDSLAQLQTNLDWLKLKVPAEILEQIDGINVIDENLLNPSTWELQKSS